MKKDRNSILVLKAAQELIINNLNILKDKKTKTIEGLEAKRDRLIINYDSDDVPQECLKESTEVNLQILENADILSDLEIAISVLEGMNLSE